MWTYVFEVKEDHLTLLDHACVSWNDMEFGAASIDPKYPYGDSQMEAGMAKILGLPFENEDYEELSSENMDYVWSLHKEMKAVLEIGFHTRLFSKGFYTKQFGEKWSAISEDEYLHHLTNPDVKNVNALLREDRY